MAMKSSGGTLSAGNTRGGSGTGLGYADLKAQGVDLDAVVADYVASNGAAGIRCVASGLNRMDIPADHFDTVENIAAMEAAKSAIFAQQADHAVAYEDSLSAARKRRNLREKNPGWGASKEVALAMRISPKGGTQFVNSSRTMGADLPLTRQGLRDGKVTWAQAQIVISGTRNLELANRQLVDRLLWEETHNCFEQGTAKLADIVAYWAKILEPKTEEDLEAKAWKNRCIGGYQINAHEVMISGTLPLSLGIAVLQVLAREAEKAQREPGEERSAGQIQADAFYELMTGLKVAGGVPLEILLVMDAAVLTGESNEPVLIPGYGFISANRARKMVAAGPDDELAIWVRGLFVESRTGQLVAMESRARRFGGNLKKLIKVRDQYCRTPYCNGKIRDIDHVVQVRKNGKTTEDNSSGRCFSCNQTKEAPDWDEHPTPGDRHSFNITTPSSHTYISKAPPLPGMKTRLHQSNISEDGLPGTGPPGG